MIRLKRERERVSLNLPKSRSRYLNENEKTVNVIEAGMSHDIPRSVENQSSASGDESDISSQSSGLVVYRAWLWWARAQARACIPYMIISVGMFELEHTGIRGANTIAVIIPPCSWHLRALVYTLECALYHGNRERRIDHEQN